MKSCVTSLYEPTCKGRHECGFYGLPHLICAPVPAYADRVRTMNRSERKEAAPRLELVD